MVRRALINLRGQRLHFRATATRWGRTPLKEPTILLEGVRNEATGDVVTGHVWMKDGPWASQVGLGHEIAFEATVLAYRRHRHVWDAELVDPCDVAIVGGQAHTTRSDLEKGEAATAVSRWRATIREYGVDRAREIALGHLGSDSIIDLILATGDPTQESDDDNATVDARRRQRWRDRPVAAEAAGAGSTGAAVEPDATQAGEPDDVPSSSPKRRPAKSGAQRQREYRERKRRERRCLWGGCDEPVQRWRQLYGPDDRRTGYMQYCVDHHLRRLSDAGAYVNVPRARVESLAREVRDLKELMALREVAPVDVTAVSSARETLTEQAARDYVRMAELEAEALVRDDYLSPEEAMAETLERMAYYGTPAVVHTARRFCVASGPHAFIDHLRAIERERLGSVLDTDSDQTPAL